MERSWRAVIVDDERLARAKLRTLLAAHPEIEIADEADSVASAVEVIAATRPDAIFLDIQMPGASGFELVNRLTHQTRIIFVTAFDEYAIRAFEINALDYLLKPVSPSRLARAVERLTSAAPTEAESARNLRPLAYDDYLFLPIGESSRFLRVNQIKCISASGAYTQLLLADGNKTLALRSLSEWESRLPERYFARIHRSTIVNLDFVARVEKWFNYSFQVYLRDLAEPLILSRRYAARLKDR